MSSPKFKKKLEEHKQRIINNSSKIGRQPKKGIIAAVATCNAKHSYATRELASAPGFRVYKCDLCYGYHRTSLPAESLTHKINRKVKRDNKTE